MFLVIESSLNFVLIAIYPMKELKLIQLPLFLAPGSNGFCCLGPIFSAIVLSRSVTYSFRMTGDVTCLKTYKNVKPLKTMHCSET